MYILITYDVSTVSKSGQSRLRRIAKICLDYGQRVQNSVFECKVDPAQLVEMRDKILSMMDRKTDSVRIYHLGKNWGDRIEHHGKNDDYNIDGPLVV